MTELNKSPGLTEEAVIEIEGLTRRFGTLTAVNSFDLIINRGEVFGFLGPNGAGKSTLFRMLMGLLSPSEGSIRILGYSIPKYAERLRYCVGYMTQKFSLYEDLTVWENLEFAAQIFGLGRTLRQERIDHVITEFGLEKRIKQHPHTMSGGWKQRLALAVCMVHKPDILFLDEPTAGVDPDSRRLFWEKLFDIAACGTTILVSTHYMDEAVRCHRICMMREGRRTALGHPAELTGILKNRIVEISVNPIESAIKIVSGLSEVESVTQLGNQIHVLLAPDAPQAELAAPVLLKHLLDAGLHQARATAAYPNLEDVFIAQAHGEQLVEGREDR